MGMDISDPFSTLPYELIFGILTSLDSPRDLISVLRASPAVHGTFINGKAHILLQVARNAFEPAALSAAVIAVRYSKTSVTKEDSCGNPDHAVNERFRLLGQLLNGSKRVPKLDEAVALCSLLSSIEAFVPACCTIFLDSTEREPEALSGEKAFDGTARHRQSLEAVALSSTELGRFQRGFVRYLTFQTLIGQLPPGRRLWTWEIATLLKKLDPWEVEEAATLHRYFLLRLQRILGDEDDPVPKRPALVQNRQSEQVRSGRDPLNQLATFPHAIFRRLLPTTKAHQGFIHHDDESRPDIFLAAINKWATFPWDPTQPPILYQEFSDFEGDHLSRPSWGYVSRKGLRNPYNLHLAAAPTEREPRTWGAVFWDQTRFEQLGLYDAVQRSNRC